MNSTMTDTASTTEVPGVASQGDSTRCQQVYPNGRRCRLNISQAGLCHRHLLQARVAKALAAPAPSDFEDLSSDLLPEPSDFTSANDLRQFLARLLVLVTKGGVSPRRAAVLAYITNQLLHSHRAIQKEADTQPQRIILDMPGPHRD